MKASVDPVWLVPCKKPFLSEEVPMGWPDDYYVPSSVCTSVWADVTDVDSVVTDWEAEWYSVFPVY